MFTLSPPSCKHMSGSTSASATLGIASHSSHWSKLSTIIDVSTTTYYDDDEKSTSTAPLPKIASRMGVEKKVKIDRTIARQAVIWINLLNQVNVIGETELLLFPILISKIILIVL